MHTEIKNKHFNIEMLVRHNEDKIHAVRGLARISSLESLARKVGGDFSEFNIRMMDLQHSTLDYNERRWLLDATFGRQGERDAILKRFLKYLKS